MRDRRLHYAGELMREHGLSLPRAALAQARSMLPGDPVWLALETDGTHVHLCGAYQRPVAAPMWAGIPEAWASGLGVWACSTELYLDCAVTPQVRRRNHVQLGVTRMHTVSALVAACDAIDGRRRPDAVPTVLSDAPRDAVMLHVSPGEPLRLHLAVPSTEVSSWLRARDLAMDAALLSPILERWSRVRMQITAGSRCVHVEDEVGPEDAQVVIDALACVGRDDLAGVARSWSRLPGVRTAYKLVVRPSTPVEPRLYLLVR